jgi:hypothetical protein
VREVRTFTAYKVGSFRFRRNPLISYCVLYLCDSLCGLVVRVPAYRSRGPAFDFRHYQIFWEVLVLERGSLSMHSSAAHIMTFRPLYCNIQIRIIAVGHIAAGGNKNDCDNKLSWTRKRTVGVCFKIPLGISTGESEIKGKEPTRKLFQAHYLQGSKKWK